MISHGRRPITDWIAAAAALGLASLLLLRVARYLPITPPEALDVALGNVLIFAWVLFIFPLLVAPWHLAGIALFIVSACVFPRIALRIGPDGWHLRPYVHALVWAECALNHYLFDVNPHLALAMVGGLLGLELQARVLRVGDLRGAHGAVSLLGVWTLLSSTYADAAAGLAFLAVLWLAMMVPRTLGLRERRLLVLLSGAGAQLLAAAIPLLLPLHGGKELGRGLAYSFCESPAAGKLFVAVPETLSMHQWSLAGAHGAEGFVAQYDLPNLDDRKELRFFSEDFYGRLEWVTCLDDRVYVGMTNATYRGRLWQDHAMSFLIANPESFRPSLMDGNSGHGIAYDPSRESLYFVSENQPVVGRLNIRTGKRERALVDAPLEKPFLSLIVGPTSYYAGRDSLFITEWLGGTHAYEVDLETGTRRTLYAHRDGGALGITVDEKMGRLYVVGVWGMEVFDIDSGKIVARKRLGLLSRSPTIDGSRGLVYVASTVEGKIRVFDQRTLELRGTIAIGHGPRIPHYSSIADKLLSGSSFAYYAWDGGALEGRFGASR